MRILWIKAGKLLPVDTGGKIRSYNLLKNLALRNETTIVSYYDGTPDKDYEENLDRELPGAISIATGKPRSLTGQILEYLLHLHSPAPFAVTKFTSARVTELLASWDTDKLCDVVVCDFLSASLSFPASFKTPTVLFQHNVESALWQRQAKHERSLIKRLVFKIESAKMTRYERSAVNKFDHVIAVSEHDRELMAAMTDLRRISVVPTGVDLKKYSIQHNEFNSSNKRILFLGSMDWEANIDGVDYFCSEIWPEIQASVPGTEFFVVGRNPPPRITRWASDSVKITGRVDSVLPYLTDAAVFVVPLRIGGGTRLKIYEAMAAGKAVVSTTVGAEGLDVNHGKDILLADSSKSFASAVIELVRDANLRKVYGVNAAALAARYDWAVISRHFEDILRRVAEHRGRPKQVSA